MAGTIIIRHGTDGLSRRDILEGIIKVESILYFVVLHKGDIKVFPPVL